MTILCWECNKSSGQHRMDCGSKSRVDTLEWFIHWSVKPRGLARGYKLLI